ncbi:MAG: DUF4837 family protein [Ignavibacterium album]|jgi:hypothetical protein|uniref:DUF4837 family protein n=1 Tax=Ignavibacterium album TaxID=591197 RepID=UPI0026ED65E3|nr:DUF4837 family protein [Ignavibacterium album]MCX8105836.1 DUF4837 family protein [Ignavibacterium album]
MKKIFLVAGLLLFAFIINSCESKKFATGLEDEIYVVADSTEYAELYDALAQTFEVEINTPLPEKLFTLKRVSPNQISSVQRKKNIIIVAPLNSGSKTSEYISSIVDDSVKKLLSNDDFYVTKYDLWARNQLVTVISANGMQELEFKILKNKDKLLYAYQKISDDRLRESLYSAKYERKEIEGKLLKDYGWIIYVQADFRLAKSVPEDNFVWLRRAPGSDMERWIFVHWIDNASPEYLNVDSIKAIRNRITEKYYRTSDDSAYVVIAQDYFVSNEVNFKGRYAIFTQGLWDLNVKGMGGPFVNYTFYDEKSNRIYMLDGSVFAPKYFKRNPIQQMDVLLQSFMTKDELSKDRIEDLLDSIDESVKY